MADIHIKTEHRRFLELFQKRTGHSMQEEVDEALERHIACALPAKLKFHVTDLAKRIASNVVSIREKTLSQNDKH